MITTVNCYAVEFRSFVRILAPAQVPDGFVKLADNEVVSVSPTLVREQFQLIADAYNRPKLREFLADDFPNADELVDDISRLVPRDAVLQVISVNGVTTTQQLRKDQADGSGFSIISTVAANIRTRLEFNDPDPGLDFVALEGTNEFVFSIEQIFETVPANSVFAR